MAVNNRNKRIFEVIDGVPDGVRPLVEDMAQRHLHIEAILRGNVQAVFLWMIMMNLRWFSWIPLKDSTSHEIRET